MLRLALNVPDAVGCGELDPALQVALELGGSGQQPNGIRQRAAQRQCRPDGRLGEPFLTQGDGRLRWTTRVHALLTDQRGELELG